MKRHRPNRMLKEDRVERNDMEVVEQKNIVYEKDPPIRNSWQCTRCGAKSKLLDTRWVEYDKQHPIRFLRRRLWQCQNTECHRKFDTVEHLNQDKEIIWL